MSNSALIFPDGRRNELDREVVVGRAPVAPPSSPSAVLVSLSVPTVSKTHALFGQSADGPWVVDLGSSNGTEVLGPSGGARRIEAGQRTSIPEGHAIRLGPDTVVVIETGAAAPAPTAVPGNSAPGDPGVF
jgi:pSer/pThr/pTyr-binding forkhead associated (FHA) protein